MRSLISPVTPSAPRSSRHSLTEGEAGRPGLSPALLQDRSSNSRFHRNFHQNDDRTVEEEVSFEQFLVVLSHFRPPSQHMTEEQREGVRKEKLRCVCL